MKIFKSHKKTYKDNRKFWKRQKISWKKIAKIILLLVGSGVLLLAILFAWYAKDLPTPAKLKEIHPVESTKILDRDGNVLYSVSGDQRRTVIDFKDMPQSIKDATISAEDSNFYHHFGFSVRGILRSVYYNLTGKKGYISGGSTITQQYVKNALLTSKKTFDRKIKELILTLEVETIYSKDKILEMYLNQIPYGSNAYGVEEASKLYFGKSAKDLTLAESATLASMPKAPTYYSPYGSHPDKLKAREDYILDRMVTLKYISSDQANSAKTEKISYKPYRENITAPHFVMYVKDMLVDQFGEDAITSEGLKVTTTLDPKLQAIAQQSIEEGYEKNVKKAKANNDALVAIDPKTGQVLSMVGSHDYFDSENDGQVNVASSPRQPGSSFKPIVYATAFKGKYNPGYTIFDVPTDFGNYSPKNYDGTTHGPVTIRQALANSLNIPAVKMLYLAGIDNSIKTAEDMGISTLTNPENYGLALVLGGAEVKLVEMTGAYGVFANQGIFHETTSILKVEDANGKILYEYKPNKGKKNVLDPQISYEISNILSDNDARSMVFGTRSALYFPDRTVAVKTGTTSEYRDAWTIGYTPSLVAGVWVGNNDNTPMTSGSAGAMAAAPIWHSFMQKALEGKDNEEFPRPDGIQELTVERFSNKLPNNNSHDFIKDIFSSWQAPTDEDNVNVTVRIDKSNGKLATEYCPADLVENKNFINLHSEVPEKENWENPVKDWAQAVGLSIGSPPSETCAIHTADKKPAILITNPKSGQNVSGTFDISVETQSTIDISYVEFSIDGVSISTKTTAPYSVSYNANNLSSGEHKITATVVNSNQMNSSSSVTINVIKDTIPPKDVSEVGITGSIGSAILSWKNPSDTDLVKVVIYVSLVSGTLGASYQNEILVNPSAKTSQTISGLVSGSKYYFTIRTVDSSANYNNSVIQYSLIIP